MAAVNGNEYDHVDFTKKGITVRHLLKDTNARKEIGKLYTETKRIISTRDSITVEIDIPYSTSYVAAVQASSGMKLEEVCFAWPPFEDVSVETPPIDIQSDTICIYNVNSSSNEASITANIKCTGTGTVKFFVAYGMCADILVLNMNKLLIESLISEMISSKITLVDEGDHLTIHNISGNS